MGLFSKSCPLEKSYIKVYGVHSPRKWKKEDCPACPSFQDGKCNYKEFSSRHQQSSKRGLPVLAKKSLMSQPAAIRAQSEMEAVNKAGFNAAERGEYLAISQQYDKLWEESSPENRAEILDSLDQWKVNLEAGLGPAEAHAKAREWLKNRADFKMGKAN